MQYIVKYTGEELEFPSVSFAEIVESYRLASEYYKAYEEVKKKLSKLVQPYLNDKGISDVHNGYMFRHTPVQRMTYDKSIMRELLDEDTYDQFMLPDKTAIDKFLKENLETLGEASTQLCQSMIPAGKPYSVTKLEKVS